MRCNVCMSISACELPAKRVRERKREQRAYSCFSISARKAAARVSSDTIDPPIVRPPTSPLPSSSSRMVQCAPKRPFVLHASANTNAQTRRSDGENVERERVVVILLLLFLLWPTEIRLPELRLHPKNNNKNNNGKTQAW